jgi:hypothetical protein
MNALVRSAVVLSIAITAATAAAPAPAAVSCHTVNARGVGQDLGGGTTAATISGGGLLEGTTAAAFVITGISGTVASFEGTIVFTVNRATLTASLTGTLDIASGAFSAVSSGIAGTGKLAGATGSLTLQGVEDLSSGSFTETVTGEICADLAPEAS